MRTLERFTQVFEQAKWFINFHKKPVWFMAIGDDYAYSVIKPRPEELPNGTVANLYDVDLNIIESVKSNKELL